MVPLGHCLFPYLRVSGSGQLGKCNQEFEAQRQLDSLEAHVVQEVSDALHYVVK